MRSRLHLLLLVLLVACGADPEGGDDDAGRGPEGDAAARPDVLLVTLDTTRADYLSCYGFLEGWTPNLDRLAAEGVRCERALSVSGLTPVAHASILTGRFQDRHGLRVLAAPGGFRLPATVPYLGAAFRDAGYATLAVHSAFPVSSHFGFDRGFERFESLEGELGEKPKRDRVGWDTNELQRRSDDTVDLCLELADELASDPERPLFAWVHLWDPHDRILLPPDEFEGELPEGYRDLPERDRRYAREVRYLDHQVGRLVEGLRARSDRGLLVGLVADHGEGLSDGEARHDWGRHHMLYQEQLHVPLLLSGPGVPEGVVLGGNTRSVDLAPTLLDYAGLEPLADADGSSLRPGIEGGADESRVHFADQVNGYDLNAGMVKKRPDAAFLYTVVEGPWKLTYRPHRPEHLELYHLDEDPLELDNRANRERERVLHLLDLLARRSPFVTEAFAVEEGVDGSAASEGLAALGYSTVEGGGELTWTWRCPEHPEFERETRGRCATCERILLPVTEWE